MNNTESIYQDVREERIKKNSLAFKGFISLLTLSFFIATPIAAAVTGIDGENFANNLLSLITGPSKLVTDYFSLGCLASTFFNAAVCGLACTLILDFSRAKATSITFAAYLLVVAHCFYGLNFVNMWFPFLGVIVYCLVMKRSLGENLHIAMFSTALAPFFSDFLFFYPPGRSLTIFGVSVLGIFLSIIFGIASGFLVAALIPGTAPMHKGFSMYKAGLAIGLLGIFIYCFLYETLGIAPHETITPPDNTVELIGNSYYIFMNVFFSVIFLSALILGFFLNGKSFKNYRQLISCSGHGLDFADKFGMPLCFINFGIYGFCILA